MKVHKLLFIFFSIQQEGEFFHPLSSILYFRYHSSVEDIPWFKISFFSNFLMHSFLPCFPLMAIDAQMDK